MAQRSQRQMMDQVFSIQDFSQFAYVSDISIASIRIRMHFESKESQRLLTRPFLHLVDAQAPKDTQPYLQVYVRHDKPGQKPLQVWQSFEQNSSDQRQRQLYSQDGQHLLYKHESKVLNGYNSHTRTAYYYIPSLDMIPFYEKAAPMRMIFHHLAEAQGWSLVHSAAVGLNGKGLLLIGAGGSGKTTTAISAALHGFTYLGDDYVLLNPKDETILSLYQSGKFRWDSERILTGIESLAINPRSDKKGFFFLGEGLANVQRSLPFSGIVIPKIGGGQSSSIRKVPSSRALMFLSASTIFQMPGSGKSTFVNISKAIKNVPAYELTLSTCSSEINHTLTELIKGL